MSGCNNTRMRYAFSPKKEQLSDTMRMLWTEHVLWTRAFIVSTVFNLSDLSAVTNRLLRNPSDFADTLTPYYGRSSAVKFADLLKEHLLIAAQLVNAAKNGDLAAADVQRRKWYANADDIAAFLAGINPYWSGDIWRSLLYDHLKMTENEAVQIIKGQYEPSIAQFDDIQKEALVMADYMTEGIIKQMQA